MVLLNEVETFEVRFLGALDMLEVTRDSQVDRRFWQENWIADVSQPDTLVDPPIAVEVRLFAQQWGELERLYVLPPI